MPSQCLVPASERKEQCPQHVTAGCTGPRSRAEPKKASPEPPVDEGLGSRTGLVIVPEGSELTEPDHGDPAGGALCQGRTNVMRKEGKVPADRKESQCVQKVRAK